MESNRKRRGFTKGKQLVMSIYKGTTRSSSSKVKPSPSPAAAHHHVVGSGFINVNKLQDVITQLPKQQKVLPPPPPHHHLEFIVNQEQVVPQSKQKVSFLLPADVGVGSGRQYDSYGILHDNINKLYSVAVDESVDTDAGTYISAVREKLRLHRVNSEHKKLQDMQQQ